MEVLRMGPDHPEWQYFRETFDHVIAVRDALQDDVIRHLRLRAFTHDRTKMELPERVGFMAMSAELSLADTEYGSPEYRAILRKYHDSAIGHHYAHNDHHPEHFPGGYAQMNLWQKAEMLADWYAATKRMKNGDLRTSILKNAERFGYDETEAQMLISSAIELGWITDGEPGLPAVSRDAAAPAGQGLEPQQPDT